ncbi:MAG: hypothetical protein AAF629_18240 [Chloroflexota bacterium]
MTDYHKASKKPPNYQYGGFFYESLSSYKLLLQPLTFAKVLSTTSLASPRLLLKVGAETTACKRFIESSGWTRAATV